MENLQSNQKKNKLNLSALYVRTIIIVIGMFLITGALYLLGKTLLTNIQPTPERMGVPEYVDVQLIDIDGAARRGEYMKEVNYIVIHYVGNPGTSAQNNRNYFNNKETNVSSHFVIGLEGEVILCVPLKEKSSASNERNADSISIEVCHPDETGRFNDVTYASLVRLTAWLCDKYNLDPETAVIRHYDVTGKLCPLYFVEHEDEWLRFKDEVKANMADNR